MAAIATSAVASATRAALVSDIECIVIMCMVEYWESACLPAADLVVATAPDDLLKTYHFVRKKKSKSYLRSLILIVDVPELSIIRIDRHMAHVTACVKA